MYNNFIIIITYRVLQNKIIKEYSLKRRQRLYMISFKDVFLLVSFRKRKRASVCFYTVVFMYVCLCMSVCDNFCLMCVKCIRVYMCISTVFVCVCVNHILCDYVCVYVFDFWRRFWPSRWHFLAFWVYMIPQWFFESFPKLSSKLF